LSWKHFAVKVLGFRYPCATAISQPDGSMFKPLETNILYFLENC